MTPCTVACQTPLSMEFSSQEYCSGLPFPTPRNLPDSGIEISLASPALVGGFFTAEPPRKVIWSLFSLETHCLECHVSIT